jgi:DNA-binding response OmpR family regulator
MIESAPILLFVGDQPVLSSLEFALSLEGFTVVDASAGTADPLAASCLVVDQGYQDDGIAFLDSLRHQGCTAPAVLLVSDINPALRNLAANAGITPIEKPLLGEELTQALRKVLSGCGNKELVR